MCPRTRENRCNGCNTVTTGVSCTVGAVGGCNSAPWRPLPGGSGPIRAGRRPRKAAPRAVVDLSDVGRLQVRLSIDREQAGEIVRGLLSRDGGHARVECGGVVVELTVEARR